MGTVLGTKCDRYVHLPFEQRAKYLDKLVMQASTHIAGKWRPLYVLQGMYEHHSTGLTSVDVGPIQPRKAARADK